MIGESNNGESNDPWLFLSQRTNFMILRKTQMAINEV